MVAPEQEQATAVPPRPPLVDVVRDNIPDELKQLDQWVLWRWHWKNGKWTKPPHQEDGRHASVTDPGTWCRFAEAWGAYKIATWQPHGIGIVLTADDPYTALDLDHCYDDFGNIAPWPELHKRWAAEAPEPRLIVERLNSYWEVSPGGHGLRVLVRAAAPYGGKAGPFELYDRDRYVTITGQCVDAPLPIQTRQKNVERLCELFLPVVEPTGSTAQEKAPPPDLPSCERILQMAYNSKDGPQLRQLYEGDWAGNYSSQSEADLALCGKLAFWCAGDAAALDTLFRDSALLRDKWDERRGSTTYGQQTLQKALAGCSEFYQWKGSQLADAAKEGESGQERPEFALDEWFVPLSGIKEQPVEWLWPQYLPRGVVAFFVGHGGLGKTWAVLDLLCRFTLGKFLPDKSGSTPKCRAVFTTVEDDLSRVVKRRVRLLGCDESLLVVMPKVACFDTHLALYEQYLQANPDTGIIACDTLTGHLSGDVDTANNNESRHRVLTPLRNLAERYRCTFLLIDHEPKARYKAAIHRVQGSVGYGGAARAIWAAEDGGLDTTTLRPIKVNYADDLPPPLSWRLQKSLSTVSVAWDRYIPPDDETKAGSAQQLILQAVEASETTTADLVKFGKGLEIGERTIKRATKELVDAGRIRLVRRGIYAKNLGTNSPDAGVSS